MITGLNFWVLSIKYEIKDLMDKETRVVSKIKSSMGNAWG